MFEPPLPSVDSSFFEPFDESVDPEIGADPTSTIVKDYDTSGSNESIVKEPVTKHRPIGVVPIEKQHVDLPEIIVNDRDGGRKARVPDDKAAPPIGQSVRPIEGGHVRDESLDSLWINLNGVNILENVPPKAMGAAKEPETDFEYRAS